ncbi:hypothetical protein [Roseomonas indoligenes]|uniref:Uncharacterized protein n=1 Tax=Roseomonas indoligenes TaxID=2820811 RepID=A0A940MYY4_9PROT|nr:hypothetical protein [Pararoseomonas indoligenes]MBP0493635.1 hypothetical protein [Pararoseomonas indoligenes]
MQQQHRFRIGEDVELIPRHFSPREAHGRYTITRLLPNDSMDREYRVKSGHDGHERVVRESEMRASATTLASRTWPSES